MERPILLKAHEVRGILDGRQTQLRRIVKPQPPSEEYEFATCVCSTNRKHEGMHHWLRQSPLDGSQPFFKGPFGQVGDHLWGREGFGLMSYDQGDECKTDIIYREDPWFLESDGKTRTDEKIGNWDLDGGRWRPAQHMQRHGSRIRLEVVSVRVERLQDISEHDARAMGHPLTWDDKHYDPPPREVDSWQGYGYASHCLKWCSEFGKQSWDADPWVWVVEFKRVEV